MTPESSRTDAQSALLKPSDNYITDLHTATHVLIAMPMYNFSVPWNFKAYIDTIVRVGKTFSFSPVVGFGPLLSEQKKLLVVWSSADTYLPGYAAESHDQLSPYIRQVFGFMGMVDFNFIAAGNQWGAPAQAQAQRCAAQRQLSALAASW